MPTAVASDLNTRVYFMLTHQPQRTVKTESPILAASLSSLESITRPALPLGGKNNIHGPQDCIYAIKCNKSCILFLKSCSEMQLFGAHLELPKPTSRSTSSARSVLSRLHTSARSCGQSVETP